MHLSLTMPCATQAGGAKNAKNLDKGVELGKLQQIACAALARITGFDELTPAWGTRLRDRSGA